MQIMADGKNTHFIVFRPFQNILPESLDSSDEVIVAPVFQKKDSLKAEIIQEIREEIATTKQQVMEEVKEEEEKKEVSNFVSLPYATNVIQGITKTFNL